MDNKTPIKEAIDFIEACIKKNKDRNDFEAGEVTAYENTKSVLQSLLPKEKEFVEKVFEAGERNARTENGVYYAAPDKEQFIYQLYPDK